MIFVLKLFEIERVPKQWKVISNRRTGDPLCGLFEKGSRG